MIIESLPDECNLHLANSMSVRYANFRGLSSGKRGVEVFSNRGTSGIDGSNSTAVGAALSTDQPVILLTGDLAFFYDRNAFWHQYPLPNLRVVVLNNHGGGIFRLINGPSQQPELETYFETYNHLNARNAASEFGFEYYYCSDILNMKSVLDVFFEESEKPKLLEIETDSKINKLIFDHFKSEIAKTYGA